MTSVEPPGQIGLGRGVDRVPDTSWQNSAETGAACWALSRSLIEQVAGRAGVATDVSERSFTCWVPTRQVNRAGNRARAPVPNTDVWSASLCS